MFLLQAFVDLYFLGTRKAEPCRFQRTASGRWRGQARRPQRADDIQSTKHGIELRTEITYFLTVRSTLDGNPARFAARPNPTAKAAMLETVAFRFMLGGAMPEHLVLERTCLLGETSMTSCAPGLRPSGSGAFAPHPCLSQEAKKKHFKCHLTCT